MSDHARLIAALCLLAVLPGGTGAVGQEAATGPAIMPLSELRPGMRGYGLWAFTDGPPHKFDCEVLSIAEGWWPKGAMILVRINGPVVDEAGIVSGMSGSPVYVDGRLIGAIAYGWDFAKVPVAGVQPIQQMLKVREMGLRQDAEDDAAHKAGARDSLRRAHVEITSLLAAAREGPAGQARLRKAVMDAVTPSFLKNRLPGLPGEAVPPDIAALLPRGAAGGISPLPLPLIVGGPALGAPRLLAQLRGGPLAPAQGAAAGPVGAAVAALQPGSPLSIVFVTGDLDISASGTVSWVDGNELLAFGHPMFGSGESNYPIATSRVATVIPNLMSSFRIAGAGEIIGRMKQDRSAAVWARLGEEAPMFPCSVRIRGAVDADYNYRVAGHWETAAMWALYAVALSAERWEGEGRPVTMEVRSEIGVRGRAKPLRLANTYVAASTVWPVFDLVADPISAIVTNPFEEAEISSLRFELTTRPTVDLALIESVTPDRFRAAPGEEVTLRVRLRPYRGGPVTETLTLRVPETAKPGTQAVLEVMDADTSRMLDRSLDPGFYEPKSLGALLEALERTEPSQNMVLRAGFTEQGLRYRGHAMPSLPPSAAGVIGFNASGEDARRLVRDVKLTKKTPWVLAGRASVRLAIVDPLKAGR